MSEREPPPSLEDLEARLEKARGRHQRREDEDGRPGVIGVALRVSIEMVGPLAVGVGIGWVLDDWLATAPLFLLVFFLLGAAAGGLNTYRRARQIAGAVDDQGPPEEKTGAREDE
ncbi:MAG: AtpZ/AtpI family protein [Proteobacteria bacterium]|nr:AtpZ/AtpI family protein [Pseudomonadota bacterium]